MSFEALKLSAPILAALKTEGYTEPTPVQAQAIPIILQGRDLRACAQTGTGKTAAFALPMLQLLHEDRQLQAVPRRPIRSLILTPTRELAIQIGESLTAYGSMLRLRHAVIFGGVNQLKQVKALQSGVDILVATPGRLLDLMKQGHVDLSRLTFFTLDEADRMLDMGFIHDVRRVIAKLPARRQTLFFSATMPPVIDELANSILNNPVEIAVTPVSSTVDKIEQQVFFVNKENKRSLLIHMLKDGDIESALVFTRTKHGADRVAKALSQAGIRAQAIHGNKSQNARQQALNLFKRRQTRVLVATDIAARGIDIDELSHVINFDIPNEPETYVHRIGRTGRAGAEGTAYSFCDWDEKKYLKSVQRLIRQDIPVIDQHPYPLEGTPPAPSAEVNAKRGGNKSRGQRRPLENATNGQDKKPTGPRWPLEKSSNGPAASRAKQYSRGRR